jgi:RNA polymerase primary sigma factor
MWDLVPDPGPSPDERVERQQQRERVWNALGDALPEREADMLRRRFGIGHYTEHSLDDIGELYGLSRERVRQLVLEGLAAVKEYLTPLRRAM